MTIPRTTARKLCTDVEYRLVNESFPPQVTELSEKALVQRIKRARTAYDRYRSLSERQAREAKGRAAPAGARPAQSNANTMTKQKIFAETLARFEKNAAPAEPKTATRRAAKKAPAKASRTPTPRKSRSAIKIPSLSNVVAKVAELVAERKISAEGADAAPENASKAPASAAEGGASSQSNLKGRSDREALLGPNPKGPDFPRNPHERGRLSSAFKHQQARKDSR